MTEMEFLLFPSQLYFPSLSLLPLYPIELFRLR